MENLCRTCKMFSKIKFNLLKKDKQRPRVYKIWCGLSPGKDVEDFRECEFYQEK